MRSVLPRAPGIVVLTGAGMLRGPGFTTFPGPQGVWATVPIEDVATPEAFARDPARVHQFYNARRRQLRDPAVKPNLAHAALAALEITRRPGDVLVATRNVDDLHERAGSRAVIHLQGELLKARCTACTKVSEWHEDILGHEDCPICGIPGQLRPGVVWIGERPLHTGRLYDGALPQCKLFLAIGTSPTIEPALSCVAEASRAGAHTVEFNAAPAPVNELFGERIYGPITETVPDYVKRLIASGDFAG